MRESLPTYEPFESLFTSRQREKGELACKSLSEKARRFYEEVDPLQVAEYEIYEENSKEPTTLYAYKFIYYLYDKGLTLEFPFGYRGLTFEELQEDFEDEYDDEYDDFEDEDEEQ